MDTLAIFKKIEMRLLEIGMSKAEFYEKSGISSASYSQWNTGVCNPSQKKLKAAAKAIGVSYEYLTGQKEKPTIPQDDGLTSIPFDDLSGEQVVTRFLKKLPTKALYELLEETTKELKRRNDD